MPLLGVLFFIPAMNLAGIPPLSGFIGKLGLLMSGVEVGTPLAWALVAGSVLTSLLTLYAVAKVWSRAFWGTPVLGPHTPDDVREGQAGRLPGIMVGGTAALVVAASRTLGAAVSVGGGGILEPLSAALPPLVEIAGELSCPWLGLYGDDEGVEAEEVDKLREVAETASGVTEKAALTASTSCSRSPERTSTSAARSLRRGV